MLCRRNKRVARSGRLIIKIHQRPARQQRHRAAIHEDRRFLFAAAPYQVAEGVEILGLLVNSRCMPPSISK
jgi:hypothetical protein